MKPPPADLFKLTVPSLGFKLPDPMINMVESSSLFVQSSRDILASGLLVCGCIFSANQTNFRLTNNKTVSSLLPSSLELLLIIPCRIHLSMLSS